MPAGGLRPRPDLLPAWPSDPCGQPEAALRLPAAAARRAARITRCQCIARASGGGTARATGNGQNSPDRRRGRGRCHCGGRYLESANRPISFIFGRASGSVGRPGRVGKEKRGLRHEINGAKRFFLDIFLHYVAEQKQVQQPSHHHNGSHRRARGVVHRWRW